MTEKTTKRRNRWIALLSLVFVACIALAFVAGYFVRSPHEDAIENSRQRPLITAEIAEREFAGEAVEVAGVASTGSQVEVKIAAGDNLAVVTATDLSVGRQVSSGTVLARVSGRPVILVELPFSLYRDIRPGDSGDDVRAVQTALQSMGLYRASVDGVYGPASQEAVKQLYKNLGLDAPSVEIESQESSDKAQASEGNKDSSSAASDPAPQPSATPRKGTPVLRAELYAIPSSQVTLEALSPVGTVLSEETPLAKLRVGSTTVTARVSSSIRESFSEGSTVTILPAGGEPMTGTVSGVSEFRNAGTSEFDTVPGYDVSFSLSNPQGVTEGQKVAITTEAAASTKGLGVPVTALREEGGKSYITRAEDSQRIEVTTGAVSDGYVMVSGEGVTAGLKVLVSTDQ